MTDTETVRADDNRVIVNGLPWVRDQNPEHRDESWDLEVDHIHVWVKRYPEDLGFEDWRGWRIGVGGSPLIRLNDGRPFKDRKAAMTAARKVAHKAAVDRVRSARTKLDEAITALEEVVLPVSDLPEVTGVPN